MDAQRSFSATYSEARAKFLAVAAARGAVVRSAVHPTQTGVQGEALAMDVATFGDPQASKTLFLVSGTHGQEGYTGSAIQIAFLEGLAIPEGVNVVALHALNPWGFSHWSRTDEDNIDLNRNFRDFAAPSPSNRLYALLHGALCPDAWTAETSDWVTVRDRLVADHGWAAVLSGLTGGQFDEPTGLNYGGRGPSWSNRTAAELLPVAFANSRKVAFVEWHTGLGAYGELCHICMHDPASAASARVFEWMGEAARETLKASFDGAEGATPSYQGLFCTWLPQAAPWADFTGLGIEVGTFDNAAVADALRIDRWLKFGRGPGLQPREALRETMMQRLYPADEAWRRLALANGCDAQQRALEGLVEW
ncbi:MAG: DUF2817 domain-containing protein [Proteobacteria bacterium]|nr:DUF2817 domain-containing protein [Pseudomonadota bacterium]